MDVIIEHAHYQLIDTERDEQLDLDQLPWGSAIFAGEVGLIVECGPRAERANVIIGHAEDAAGERRQEEILEEWEVIGRTEYTVLGELYVAAWDGSDTVDDESGLVLEPEGQGPLPPGTYQFSLLRNSFGVEEELHYILIRPL